MFDKFKNTKIFFCALCLVMLTAQIKAAVVADNRSSGGAFSNEGVTTLSFPHTIGNGTSRALYVGISTTSAAALPAVCPVNVICQAVTPVAVRTEGVMYNNLPMEFVGRGTSSNTQNVVELYRLVEPLPTAGSYNIVVSFVPGTATHAVGNAVSFTGVNQITPDGGFVSNFAVERNDNPFIQVGNTTTDKIVFDTLAASPTAGFFVEGNGQTVCQPPVGETTCMSEIDYTRGRRFFSNAYDVGASSAKIGAANSTVMSWTMSNADNWVLGAVAINPLGATAAGVSVSGRVLLPSGRGINRARIMLTDSNGETRTAFTDPFGYYRFEDVIAGETYVFDIKAKHNSFVSQVIVVNEETNELNFTAARSSKR